MFPAPQDLDTATAFRRALHRRPELSGEERGTAAAVAALLAGFRPDRLVTGLGGHGVAAVFVGAEAGETILLRAELDALPIPETGAAGHRSEVAGKGHLCGHDGHTAILVAVAAGLARRRPRRGRVVLLFQPAEETGAGAAAVIADPGFAALRPDRAFALHNLPGLPLGAVALKVGIVNCASRGLRVVFSGRTAHAATPHEGRSPLPALAQLMPAFAALGGGGRLDEGFRLVTVTHAVLGAPTFGVAPGLGEVWATLRTLRDAAMAELVHAAESLAAEAAEAAGLEHAVRHAEVFPHCENHPDAVAAFAAALDRDGLPHAPGAPMRASEDFGRFGAVAPSAMLFLGAGTDHPGLHAPDYDFPDALIPIGSRIFARLIEEVLG